MTLELHRPVALDRIGPHGLAVEVEAGPDELPAIATRLRILAVASLHCAFKLRRVGADTIEAQGVLRAQVTETCVVSLDPFCHGVQEAFTVHFVPSGAEDDNPDPEAIDQIPYSGSAADLGEAAVEQLALALDPFPRKPGAALPADATDEMPGPFAALLARRARE
jgi:uncharacterized metal-binding protein YceD (DUF177 family)